jgi:hypothetical protein
LDQPPGLPWLFNGINMYFFYDLAIQSGAKNFAQSSPLIENFATIILSLRLEEICSLVH